MAKLFLPKIMVLERGGKTYYFKQHKFTCENCLMRNTVGCDPIGEYCYNLYKITHAALAQPFSCVQVTKGNY